LQRFIERYNKRASNIKENAIGKKQTPATLMELAVNNGNNQKNKDRNDSNRNYPIRSHPARYR
jgi:hypothetical protein